MPHDYLKPLLVKNEKKIVLLVLDGLGGLPLKPGGRTELETANTPNMDMLAKNGTLGLSIPIEYGITPGSGPAHLSLFGYDPFKYQIGRGALECAGVGLQVNHGDVAARGNFCTLDENGLITDRRAGRIPNAEAIPIVSLLSQITIPGVEVELKHVKEHRFAIVMRGDGLSPELHDTDPQKTGVKPLPVQPIVATAQKTADLFNQWIAEAQKLLKDQPKANGLTLRGFATDPRLPTFEEAYHLKAACVAVYPMYRGVAKLVGMDIIDFNGDTPEDEFTTVKSIWDKYDFFFIHIKKTDSTGEDGNFEGKVKVIETVDKALPKLLNLNPDVLIITGDHSTPSLLKSHSWHPVPFLLYAPETHIPDSQTEFGERACTQGGLGTFKALATLPLALAHAEKLIKFGA